MTKEELEKACQEDIWLLWERPPRVLIRAKRCATFESSERLRLATPNDMLKYEVWPFRTISSIPDGIFFNFDGTIMYISSSHDIAEYGLTTPHDISTAHLTKVELV